MKETIKDIERAIKNGHTNLEDVLRKFKKDGKTKPYTITVIKQQNKIHKVLKKDSDHL